MVTFDLITTDGLYGNVRTIHLRITLENITKLTTSYLRLQHVYIHRFRHFLFVISITITPPPYPFKPLSSLYCTVLKSLQTSLTLLLGLLVLRIVLQKVLSYIVNWILRLVFFLRQSRKSLKYKRDHSLVKISPNRQSF